MSGGLYSRYVPPKTASTVPAPVTQASPSLSQEHKPGEPLNETKKPKPKEKRKEKKRKRQTEIVVQTDEEDVVRSKQHQHVLAKYDKSIRVSAKIKEQHEDVEDNANHLQQDNIELHDIVPLPQPAPVKREPYRPNFTSLPQWLSKPTLADPQDCEPFDRLGLSSKVLSNLKKRSYQEAFPVQTTLVPLLLQGPSYYYGDICVSAPTGSGKTLGYVLPLIEHLKNKICTNLRAVIVVPTRELVVQVRQEAELCAAGTSVQIGTALGSTNIVAEREQLIFRDQRYDPDKAAKLNAIIQERISTGFMEDDSLLDDAQDLLPQHVPDFRPNIDLLICTPGRLVEHIRTTTGFTLKRVKHLVIDEADRLLDESFQEWVDITLSALNENDDQILSAGNKMLQQSKYVQKVILSATMTQDLGKLAALRLQRPCLIAVVASADNKVQELGLQNGHHATNSVEMLELPASLKEVAVPIGDGSEKPLYLLKLLVNELSLTGVLQTNGAAPKNLSRVLVFTNNNEDALRLRHMLVSMQPELDSHIGVLTKTTTKSGRKTLSAFKAGRLSILIASDRASRGLDVPDLTDVISYDMPKSETLYIHRVGRTARAGQSGTGWTLVSDTEARWFWNAIARTSHIQRGDNKVERYKLLISEDDLFRTRYAEALENLKNAVLES